MPTQTHPQGPPAASLSPGAPTWIPQEEAGEVQQDHLEESSPFGRGQMRAWGPTGHMGSESPPGDGLGSPLLPEHPRPMSSGPSSWTADPGCCPGVLRAGVRRTGARVPPAGRCAPCSSTAAQHSFANEPREPRAGLGAPVCLWTPDLPALPQASAVAVSGF